MVDSENTPRSSNRLRRLTQWLLVLVAVWGIVQLFLWLRPAPVLDAARDSVKTGHFDQAVEQYLRHLAREPEDWNVRLELGMVLATMDRPQALAEFRKIPPGTEAFPEAKRQIALICFATERYLEAEEALLALGEELHNDSGAQLMLGELYLRQRRASTALPFVRRSLELDADQPRAHFLLAELLDELGRPAEMIEPLQRALALTPEDYATHLNLSYAYSEAGKPEESRREANWCLARRPEDVAARRLLAKAARDLGDRTEALAEIQRTLELAPQDLPSRLLEAELLLFDQQAGKALERLKPLLEQHPQDRRLLALLAQAASAAGNGEQAKEYRDRLQKLRES